MDWLDSVSSATGAELSGAAWTSLFWAAGSAGMLGGWAVGATSSLGLAALSLGSSAVGVAVACTPSTVGTATASLTTGASSDPKGARVGGSASMGLISETSLLSRANSQPVKINISASMGRK